jgi:hypothetical protein
MYLLGCVAGIEAQERLWSFFRNDLVSLHQPTPDEWKRINGLMVQYADMPLDLADASLISAAEQRQDFLLFTVDQALRAVRVADKRYFDIVP